MVFAIQQHEKKSLLFTSCYTSTGNILSDETNISNNNSDVSLPVVSMYDSFVPWLSPHILESSCSKGLQEQPHQQRQSSPSWLSRLFGRKENKTSDWEVQKQSCDDENEDGGGGAHYFVDPLDENQYIRTSLMFPPQAHSLARFHLSCIQAKRHVVNFGRVAHPQTMIQATATPSTTTTSNHDNHSSFFTCASLEIGSLTDFFPPERQQSASSSQSELIRVMDTSDKTLLLETVHTYRQSTTRMSGNSGGSNFTQRPKRKLVEEPHLPWHPSHVRVAALGYGCRCVSWGFDNGTVIVYKNIDKYWTTVASVTVNTALSNEHCRFSSYSGGTSTNDKHNMSHCPSLNRVSDIVPLLIPTFDGKSTVAILIVSRIGGFIEIHPLPSSVWTPGMEDDIVKGSNKKQRSAASVIQLSSDSVAIIDPRQYHGDTICIDVHLQDRFSTKKSSSLYGNQSPICLTIAASGTSYNTSTTGNPSLHRPVISLWSVEILTTTATTSSQRQCETTAISSIQSQFIRVFSPSCYDDHDSIQQQQHLSSPSFSCCRVVADTFLLKRYLSPSTTTTNNRATWATLNTATKDIDESEGKKKLQCLEPIIEFSAPYIQLKLTPSLFPSGSGNSINDRGDRLLITALDYYGTISLFDFDFEANTNDQVQLISTASLSNHNGAFVQFQWLLPLPLTEDRNHQRVYLGGVSQSGLLIIAKLEAAELEDGATDYSSRRLKVVFCEQYTAAATGNRFTIMSQGLGNCNQGISFVRCLISRCVDDIDDGAKSNVDKRNIICSLCSVRELEPDVIVKQLVWAGKYQEAISLNEKYVNSQKSYAMDTDSIYKELWEARTLDSFGIGNRSSQPLDVDDVEKYLCSIQDDEYVSRVSAYVYLNLSNASALVSILLEGRLRLTKLLNHGVEEETTEIRARIQLQQGNDLYLIERRIVYLGTYEWLCNHLGAGFQSSTFFVKFMATDMLSIAKECALKGDIDALFMMFLRHSEETLSHRLELLSLLPPTVCPASYKHLLPVMPAPGAGSAEEHTFEDACFFFLVKSNSSPVNLKCLLSNFDTFFPKSHINVCDIACLESAVCTLPDRLNDIHGESNNSQTLASWYVAHALNLEKNGGNLWNAIYLCQFGLERLSDQEHIGDIPPELLRLDALSVALSHLDQCTNSGAIPETMAFSEWKSLEVSSAVRLILGDETDPPTVLSRWEACIKPIINYCQNDTFRREWGWQLSVDCVNFQEEIERSVVAYVLFRCSQNRPCGLSICLLFAYQSRASLLRSSRIIRSEAVLIKLILDCIYDCKTCSADNTTQFIKIYWDIYESLPARRSITDDSNSHMKALHDQIDVLEKHLIATEISSHYFSPLPLQAYLASDSSVFDVILVRMCNSMRNRAIRNEADKRQKLAWKEYITLFAVDLKELKSRFPIDLSIVEENLFYSLLHDHKFLALKELYLEFSQLQDFMFLRGFKNEVQRFIQSGQIEEAAEIVKYFLFLFPGIEGDMKRKKCLDDALTIIHEALECLSITRVELETRSPFDVIEGILMQNPFAIVYGNEWNNQEYCKEQNLRLWNEFVMGSHSSRKLLPGQIVHQLAMMLGLSTELDEFCVNQLMISKGIQAGLYGAAAGIYISSLRFGGTSINRFDPTLGQDLSSTLLRNAVSLVTANDYTDFSVRKELCAHTLSFITLTRDENCSPAFSFDMSQGYSTLAEQYAMIEANQMHERKAVIPVSSDQLRGLELRQETHNEEASEFLVFKAAEFVAKGAKNFVQQMHEEKEKHYHEYLNECWSFDSIPTLTRELFDPMFQKLILDQEEFGELFMSFKLNLLSSFRGGVTDLQSAQIIKSTMSVIGRRSFALCISESAMLRDRQGWQKKQYSSTSDISCVIQLAVCILLESIDGSSGTQIALELQGQLEEEVAITLEQAAAHEGHLAAIPDEDIVRRLRHHGYSLNGARRAAIATRSFGAALSYAIAHCQDKDFDLPMLKIQGSSCLVNSPPYVDQQLVHQIRDALQFLMHLKLGAGASFKYSTFFSQLNCTASEKKASDRTLIRTIAIIPALSAKHDGKNTSEPALKPASEGSVLHSAGQLNDIDHFISKSSASSSIVRPPSRPIRLLTATKKPHSLHKKTPVLLSSQKHQEEKSESSSLVSPTLLIRTRVDKILSNAVSPKELGDAEKQELAKQGRLLLEASRKARLSAPSSGVGVLESNRISENAHVPDSVQPSLPSGQHNLPRPQEEHLKQGATKEKQEGWDFDEDW